MVGLEKVEVEKLVLIISEFDFSSDRTFSCKTAITLITEHATRLALALCGAVSAVNPSDTTSRFSNSIENNSSSSHIDNLYLSYYKNKNKNGMHNSFLSSSGEGSSSNHYSLRNHVMHRLQSLTA